MIETGILVLFALSLILCLLLHLSELIALLVGLSLFIAYAFWKGCSKKAILTACLRGILDMKGILILFVLIGIMTGLWRAGGTLPWMVSSIGTFLNPGLFLVIAFLACAAVGYVSGSSFGTAASVGAACSAIGCSMNIPIAFLGGAILSGCYFADRCAPYSSSVILTSKSSGFDHQSHVHQLMKSTLTAFLLCLILYALMGLPFSGRPVSAVHLEAAEKAFRLNGLCLLPALATLVLSLFRVDGKIAMAFSSLIAFGLCLFLQKMALPDIFETMVFGYRAQDPAAGLLFDGGGILSMAKVIIIIAITSGYMALFDLCGFLNPFTARISDLVKGTGHFGLMLPVALACSMLFCNQTFSIVMLAALFKPSYQKPAQLALDLGDSAVLLPACVPWSIAASVPLSSIGAPYMSILFAFYLYLIPLLRVFRAVIPRILPRIVHHKAICQR